MRKFWIVKAILFVALAITVFSYLVMSLWNWLVPDLFHGPIITWGQAIGLLILSKLLFGGFKKGGWCGGRGGWHHRREYWKERMEARMAGMTPEEKEKFREQMRKRCGGWWSDYDAEKGPEQAK